MALQCQRNMDANIAVDVLIKATISRSSTFHLVCSTSWFRLTLPGISNRNFKWIFVQHFIFPPWLHLFVIDKPNLFLKLICESSFPFNWKSPSVRIPTTKACISRLPNITENTSEWDQREVFLRGWTVLIVCHFGSTESNNKTPRITSSAC